MKSFIGLAACVLVIGCADQGVRVEPNTEPIGAPSVVDTAIQVEEAPVVEVEVDEPADVVANVVEPDEPSAADGAPGAATPSNAELAMVYSPMKDAELPNINAGIIVPTDPSSVRIGEGTPTFIDFFGFWCATCQAMAPTIEATKVQYQDAVAFVHLDVDDPANAELLELYGVNVTPTFVLLDADGHVFEQWRGSTDQTEIEGRLAEVVADAS